MSLTRLRLTALLLSVLICWAAPLQAQDNWFSNGVVFATVGTPIAANQVLADGRHNDQANEFVEEVDLIAASSVTGFVAFQRIAADNTTVLHSQPVQVGLGASPNIHFHVVLEPGEHLRVINLVQITTTACAAGNPCGMSVSLLYTN